MSARVLTTFRLEEELLERLDAHAERMTEATPGLKVTRSDALRVLVMKGLAEAEEAAKVKPKKR